MQISSSDIESIETCHICNSNELLVVSKAFLNNESVFEISACKNCSFTFKTKRLSLKWYEKLWSSTSNNTEQISPTYRDKLRYHRYGIIEKLLSKHVSEKQVLDLGSNSGYGLKSFFDKGWQTTGVEPDTKSCNFGNGLGLKMINQSIETFVTSSDKQFSSILLIHTLEHLHYPVDLLENIAKMIKDDGFFYIEVPNIRESGSWIDCIDYHHLNYFYEYTLLGIIQKLGFKPITKIKTKTQPWGSFHLGILCQKTPSKHVTSNKLGLTSVQEIFHKGMNRNFQDENPILFKINDIFDCDHPYLIHKKEQKFVNVVKTNAKNYIIKKDTLNLKNAFLHNLAKKYGILKDKNFENFQFSEY